jgi:Flp pilus assembly protein TadG
MTHRLIHDRSGASAAEFAIVLPLLLVLLLGIIDAGRWLWTVNQAEKATQMGARFAVVGNPVTSAVADSYLGVGGLTQGDPIPASDFGKITCTGTGSTSSVTASCSCTITPCPSGANNNTAFQNIVKRISLFVPGIQPSNVTVEYSSSGLGYAGNPNGADLSPLVTVKLSGVKFVPITSMLLATIPLPTVTTSLTAEDLSGSASN